MAYQSINNSQNTTNYSQRDINQQFNLVEFNKLFEQNNLISGEKENTQELQKTICPKTSNPKILFIIVCVLLILGILLLLYNNFIIVDEETN